MSVGGDAGRHLHHELSNRPPVTATVTDYRAFTDYRREPCMCGEAIYAGGFPAELIQRVAAHNERPAHRSYRERIRAYLYGGSPRPEDASRDLSEPESGASADAVEDGP